MVMKLILIFMFALLVGTQATIPISLTAQTGVHFKQVLIKDDFFPAAKNVKLTASLNELPDLPTWLKLEQQDPYAEATLYGTPSDSDIKTVKLELIAWNKDTYETQRKVVLLTVVKLDSVIVKHQLEFKIRNKDAADILQGNNKFLQTVRQVWPGAEFVTSVERPTHRKGGSYPLPGQKEGVYVTVGGKNPIPANLKVLQSICTGIPSENVIAKVFSDAGFDVDWCVLKETIVTVGTVVQQAGKDFVSGDEFIPASLNTQDYHNEPEQLTSDIAFIFIPLAMGLALIVVLTCVTCFTHKDTVHQHSNSRRAAPHTGNVNGFAYGQLDEEKAESRSGTLNRLNNSGHDVEVGSQPPPYRNPPKVSNRKMQDSSF